MMSWIQNGHVVLSLVLTVSALVSGVLIWFHKRMKNTAVDATLGVVASAEVHGRRISELEKDMDQIRQSLKGISADLSGVNFRVGKIEQTLGAMPGREELHRLQIAMTEMSGEIKAMAASYQGTQELLKRLEAVVTRQEDYLLERKK